MLYLSIMKVHSLVCCSDWK